MKTLDQLKVHIFADGADKASSAKLTRERPVYSQKSGVDLTGPFAAPYAGTGCFELMSGGRYEFC
jgi:hypothetical protein